MRRLTIVFSLVALFCVLAFPGQGSALPPIKHVWVIELENKTYDATFVNNKNPYLGHLVPQAGSLMRKYYGTSHASLGNYVTQISGQAPNILTQADCLVYIDVLPGIIGTDEQAIGQGCVYPPQVKTLPDQLEAKGLTWKGYMEDLGNDPTRESTRCGAPKPNSQDHTQSATAKDQYAARHNPFVYFHSILDPPGRCAAHVGPLPPLADDLKSIATTPNFSWITPNLCNDAHDGTPCAGTNAKGTKDGGLVATDAFLAKWVPVIMNSPAFRADGLLLVMFDESDSSDSASCCGEPTGLNTPFPGISGSGGGITGAVALSQFIKPGSVDDTKYNHYSLLKSLEQIFGINQYLGYANMPGLSSFGDDVFNRPAGGAVTIPGATTPGTQKLAVHMSVKVPKTLAGMRSRLRQGLAVTVTVTGTDHALYPVRVRLARAPAHKGGRAVTIAATKARTLRNGRGTITLTASAKVRARLKRGHYLLIAESRHGSKAVGSASRTVNVR